MVHIKRLELTNFKSFGGTTAIPLLPVFTVVSGPNGSGKSNILDALLFALGLSTSKGMRAERLPDLVNNTQNPRGTIEASVTVTFDLTDEPAFLEEKEDQEFWGETENGNGKSAETEETPPPALPSPPSTSEWSVTRKLRVTKQGTYTSNYYINGSPCTLTELHEQLNRLRIYPEGYNVVLQGDVTSIISMNPRERREIIDELAGVAAFDRKIVLAKEKLDEVKEHEERSRIVEKELIAQRDRLASDRSKAEKYQKLRVELHEKEQLEIVLVWRQLQQQEWQLREHIEAGERTCNDLTAQISTLTEEISQATAELDRLNACVKALGEEELLSVQSTLASQAAENRQLQNRRQELETAQRETENYLSQTEKKVKEYRQTLEQLTQQHLLETKALASRQQERDEAQQILNELRVKSETSADASEAWVQQQTELHRQIETLQQSLNPQRTEQAKLRERADQLERQLQEQSQSLQTLEAELAGKQAHLADNQQTRHPVSQQQVEFLTQAVAAAEQELQTQQETQKRLLGEQREKQRQLDKLEAQAQAMQEATGTGASQVITAAGIRGVCGSVAQLGRTEPRFQLALETAAGGRLGNLVVEDDSVAAAAIALLKQKRAGRATFLPLNKIRPGRFSPLNQLNQALGFIDYAINLIDCDPRYDDVFAYVFGNTAVFDILDNGRRYLGQIRIVTLEGDILESTGAMTGGSTGSAGSRLHFGTGTATESGEIPALRSRLQEIEQILERCTAAITQATVAVKARNQELIEAKQQQRESQLKSEQIQTEIKNLTAQQEQLRLQLVKNNQELSDAQGRLYILEVELPAQEAQLQQHRQALAELEQSQTHSEWQQIQVSIRAQEAKVNDCLKAVRSVEQTLQDLENQRQRLEEKIQESHQRLEEYNSQRSTQQQQNSALTTQHLTLQQQIVQTKASLALLEEKLGEEKQARDLAESQLRERHLAKQQRDWQLQKHQENQQARREKLETLHEELQAKQAELPDPLPAIPEKVDAKDLSALQQDVRSLQKRLQAMEPVNMLALEEYERTQTRLDELSQKLATLEGERTELLLRIENFTTLRLRAFKEAFDAVNENFQTIFAELSDGDGYLQLDDPEDPFSAGLNLVAHPKGKPVQRLASMSGGEKSLTALSFIFALQRYRPSPFYAFDEVDMFLDGANVERLAKMIKQQAQQAQFIVVSLRRPMIESSERTIGVTQARGAYTQVIGLNLQSKSASV
ncbi:chromosome segregation protein SMC [Microcoleus sp. FACHB-68]|uniref:chromosome segregation protein SMC n=1 Tax=Microcoleus sp. FACHB-68 TaxID=2692826 RepID=UPI0016846E9D|nr:chromosome segregation protein SMC [Microcoleus sp. FACHB-68]MBD1937730.1 chromosome segregation protein SMC [Microcoleus sp. FACHB-68]